MAGYYSERLSGERLRRCYELAPARVRRYLDSEIEHVLSRLRPDDAVLELGCGYGRVVQRLAGRVRCVVGIDVARDSLKLARQIVGDDERIDFLEMDATRMSFRDDSFDAVVCVQNGICAFGVPVDDLVRESLRVAKSGGRILLSTYTDAFWDERLAWFERQAAAGLVGPIDRAATRRGVIVCKDGFRAGTMSAVELSAMCERLGVKGSITEVDRSSLFCEVVKPLEG